MIVLAAVAGLLIGLSLGALGGGGSILAVPVLVYLLDQSPAAATTGSLVVVGVSSVIGAIAARRAVLLGRGLVFGALGVGGALLGAKASGMVPEPVLLLSFAGLMVVVGALMLWRQFRGAGAGGSGALDEPIITFSPAFMCRCPQAAKVLVAATAVGLLTGFLGVGGGFLVVPALVLALDVPMQYAAGTSLVAIAVNSASALVVRAGSPATPDWGLVLVLTVASAAGGILGAVAGRKVDTRQLSRAFTALILAVAVFTGAQAVSAL